MRPACRHRTRGAARRAPERQAGQEHGAEPGRPEPSLQQPSSRAGTGHARIARPPSHPCLPNSGHSGSSRRRSAICTPGARSLILGVPFRRLVTHHQPRNRRKETAHDSPSHLGVVPRHRPRRGVRPARLQPPQARRGEPDRPLDQGQPHEGAPRERGRGDLHLDRGAGGEEARPGLLGARPLPRLPGGDALLGRPRPDAAAPRPGSPARPTATRARVFVPVYPYVGEVEVRDGPLSLPRPRRAGRAQGRGQGLARVQGREDRAPAADREHLPGLQGRLAQPRDAPRRTRASSAPGRRRRRSSPSRTPRRT